MAIEWDIQSDSEEPGGAGCDLRGGRATVIMDTDVESAEDLHAAILDLIGSTSLAVTDGRLRRAPPKAHPVYPWMVVSNIASIRGYGEPTWEDPQPELEVPPLRDWPLYPHYRFTVEFSPRPYPTLTDDKVTTFTELYFEDDGTPVPATWAREWERYTDFEVQSLDSWVEARSGQMMVFRTQSGDKPNTLQYQAGPRMQLPDGLFKIRWYGVPYRFISSPKSYIRKFRGRINQTEFKAQGHTFAKGQLLYTGYTSARYTPPVPMLDEFTEGLFSTEKLCDIELNFLETDRVGDDLPLPANPNWIAGGWNLLPHLPTKGFFYATVALKDEPAGYDAAHPEEWTPTFHSFPLELLATDPDFEP
jgi:hypothetical protein